MVQRKIKLIDFTLFLLPKGDNNYGFLHEITTQQKRIYFIYGDHFNYFCEYHSPFNHLF